MYKAMEIASWFINNEYQPTNNIDGNLKLNKLLYLAQMVSLAEYNEPLFVEDLYAFENVVVVEDIRKYYHRDYRGFISEAKSIKKDFNERAKNVLEITKKLFMDVSPSDLSELTHQHLCWKYCYDKSRQTAYNGFRYNKNNAIIDINDFENKFIDDVKAIKEAISALLPNDEISEDKIVINGVSYYYNPSEIDIKSIEVESALNEFTPQDLAYTIYLDDSQGVIIF